MEKFKLDINYGEPMADFMGGVMKTLVQQDDYAGIGGHGLANHGGHGDHEQTSIGLGNLTINFRNLK